MAKRRRVLLIAVRPGTRPGRVAEVVRWIRRLVPAAVLLVGALAAPPVDVDADEVISIEVDAVESGPLSLANELVRRHRMR